MMGIPFQETIFETNLLNLIVVIYIVVTVVGEALTRELETRQKKISERYRNSLQKPAEDFISEEEKRSRQLVESKIPPTIGRAMERKRIEQIEKEHSKRIIQARYQQMGLLRSRVLVHRKADLIHLFSKVD